jgi:hypothetical protein
VRKQYLEAITELIERYKRELRSAGIDYTLLETSTPLEHGLMSYLFTRKRSF